MRDSAGVQSACMQLAPQMQQTVLALQTLAALGVASRTEDSTGALMVAGGSFHASAIRQAQMLPSNVGVCPHMSIFAGVAQLTQPSLSSLTCHLLACAHMAATCLAALQGEASKSEPCPLKLTGRHTAVCSPWKLMHATLQLMQCWLALLFAPDLDARCLHTDVHSRSCKPVSMHPSTEGLACAGAQSFGSLIECAWCLLDVAQLSVCRLGAAFGQDLVHVTVQHLQEAPFGTPQELVAVLTNHLP